MQTHISTTPVGRRTLTLAHLATQVAARERPAGLAAHKWNVFRDACAAKERLGVSDRSLAVLNALLSFHQDVVLTGDDVLVYPSNAALSLRANGMSGATLRRHLAALVDAGLIIRRDSANGKRFVRKGRAGEPDIAFGFDLSPLIARAVEVTALAEQVRADEAAVRATRERITILRRDIAKMISTGLEEAPSSADWLDFHASLAACARASSRRSGLAEMTEAAESLYALAQAARTALEAVAITTVMSANESQGERHIQNSNTEPSSESETANREERGGKPSPNNAGSPRAIAVPLSLVLQACPDVADYAKNAVRTWHDLTDCAGLVRTVLGVSPSAWREAQEVLGADGAAVTIAAILQRGDKVSSPGGYLRSLIARARKNEFSLNPMLFALLRSQAALKQGGQTGRFEAARGSLASNTLG